MGKKRVLVVDDEIFIRELVKDFLELENIDCDEAGNPQDALMLLAKNSYDLILLDRNLENFLAENVVADIKKIDENIPILMLTGDHNCTHEYLESIGVDGVIFKPFQVDEFLTKINSMLESE